MIGTVKDVAKAFCEARAGIGIMNVEELAVSIVVESSELLELFRFRNKDGIRVFSSRANRERICDEIADVLFVLVMFVQVYDVDIATEFRRKIVKSEGLSGGLFRMFYDW